MAAVWPAGVAWAAGVLCAAGVAWAAGEVSGVAAAPVWAAVVPVPQPARVRASRPAAKTGMALYFIWNVSFSVKFDSYLPAGPRGGLPRPFCL